MNLFNLTGESMAGIITAVLILLAVYKYLTRPGGSFENVPGQVVQWESWAKKYASKYGVPWQIVLAQIWQESAGQPGAVGSAGEQGLMQLKQIAIDDLLQRGYGPFPGWDRDPEQNIKAGTAFLALQADRAGQIYSGLANVRTTALEAYNEGYSQSKKDLGPDEYAEQVMARARKFGYDA